MWFPSAPKSWMPMGRWAFSIFVYLRFSLPCLENSFRRDEFRYHYIHSKLLADSAENGVRHSSHWSQEQREIRFEEREGSGTVGKVMIP